MIRKILTLFALLCLTTLAHAEGELRHVVIFKFKKEASAEQIAEISKAFAALPKQIDSIKDFEWGTDISTENKAKGFTHCFLVTFADKAGLEAYLPHEAHKAFVTKLKPILEDAFVFDYVAK